MPQNRKALRVMVTVASFLVLLGCGTLSAIYGGGNIENLTPLILQVEKALTFYEDFSIPPDATETEIAVLEAFQAARKAAIMIILDQIEASGDPTDTIPYRERLMVADNGAG